ncbi:hypothetical protein [Desulfospira joergensenii]|uniref:hypothetical protein n=1 Tax=Desulfospira joergensenii TaxID=53329 RepID=UPI0003B49836|nr:hypothetical protein [Desulfospira joergensenii]
MPESCIRQNLPNVKDFKQFWKDKGPYLYALTSAEFPPVLLEEEEWIFGSDIVDVLKELMQFDKKKMGFVQAPFNPRKKGILRPENMIPWKIKNFPEEWNHLDCRAFVPEGHLTRSVMDEAEDMEKKEARPDKKPSEAIKIEAGFFTLLEKDLEDMGYVLLKPLKNSKSASVRDYLEEWEEDEKEAGII